jgi:hypothetical protein
MAVVNPSPGGGTSSPLPIQIEAVQAGYQCRRTIPRVRFRREVGAS